LKFAAAERETNIRLIYNGDGRIKIK